MMASKDVNFSMKEPNHHQITIDPPPSYSESIAAGGSSHIGTETINLLNPHIASNVSVEKLIKIQKVGGSFQNNRYIMNDANGREMFEATTNLKYCDGDNDYYFVSLLENADHVTVSHVGPQHGSSRDLEMITSSNRKLGYINILSTADSDGNVLKIRNEQGHDLFNFKMIVTQAMLGEPNLAREVAYEIITSSGVVVGKLVDSRSQHFRYKFSYTLPLDIPTLSVILCGIFGLEDIKAAASRRSFKIVLTTLAAFFLFTVVCILSNI